jgi:hypothetical protein
MIAETQIARKVMGFLAPKAEPASRSFVFAPSLAPNGYLPGIARELTRSSP